MGPAIVILLMGGAIVVAAKLSKAGEPSNPAPSSCDKTMNAVAKYGAIAGPKGEVAAKAAEEHGDTVCDVVEKLQEFVQSVAEFISNILAKRDGAEYDPDEKAHDLADKVKHDAKTRTAFMAAHNNFDARTSQQHYDAVYNFYLANTSRRKGDRIWLQAKSIVDRYRATGTGPKNIQVYVEMFDIGREGMMAKIQDAYFKRYFKKTPHVVPEKAHVGVSGPNPLKPSEPPSPVGPIDRNILLQRPTISGSRVV